MPDVIRRIASNGSWTAVGILCSLVALAVGPARGDDAGTNKRWAILVAEPQLGRLADLLTAELSADLELVERDQLDRVLGDAGSGNALRRDDAARRLHLRQLQLLQAKRLLLSIQENEPQQR